MSKSIQAKISSFGTSYSGHIQNSLAIIQLLLGERRATHIIPRKSVIPTVMYRGGQIITQVCFSANSTEALHIIEGNIHSVETEQQDNGACDIFRNVSSLVTLTVDADVHGNLGAHSQQVLLQRPLQEPLVVLCGQSNLLFRRLTGFQLLPQLPERSNLSGHGSLHRHCLSCCH